MTIPVAGRDGAMAGFTASEVFMDIDEIAHSGQLRERQARAELRVDESFSTNLPATTLRNRAASAMAQVLRSSNRLKSLPASARMKSDASRR